MRPANEKYNMRFHREKFDFFNLCASENVQRMTPNAAQWSTKQEYVFPQTHQQHQASLFYISKIWLPKAEFRKHPSLSPVGPDLIDPKVGLN